MNLALWIVQGLLAAVFLMAGRMKIFAYEKYRAMAGPNAPSKHLALFIGSCEIAGAVGVVLPWATGVLSILTPIASSALALMMVLALGDHSMHKDRMGKFIPPIVLLLMSLFVAWGRF